MSLRNKLIRLAHEKPELRGHLLPLLKEAGSYQDYRSKSKAHPPLSKEQWEKKQESLKGMSHADLKKHHEDHKQKANDHGHAVSGNPHDQEALHSLLHHEDHAMITKDHMDARGEKK